MRSMTGFGNACGGDLSAGISGEVVHVDGGFSIAAMNELELK